MVCLSRSSTNFTWSILEYFVSFNPFVHNVSPIFNTRNERLNFLKAKFVGQFFQKLREFVKIARSLSGTQNFNECNLVMYFLIR